MVIKIVGNANVLFIGNLDDDAVKTLLSYAKGKDGYIKQYDEVIQAVCNYFELRPTDIMLRCRAMELTMARALIYYRLVIHFGYTRSEVGKLFGRTHATVINGIKSARNYYHIAYKNIFKEEIK